MGVSDDAGLNTIVVVDGNTWHLYEGVPEFSAVYRLTQYRRTRRRTIRKTNVDLRSLDVDLGVCRRDSEVFRDSVIANATTLFCNKAL